MSTERKFSPGRVVSTRGALEVFSQVEIGACLVRHLAGDWGDVGDEDRQNNEENLKTQNMLMSIYRMGDVTKVLWIITDPGWETTTALLPSEY